MGCLETWDKLQSFQYYCNSYSLLETDRTTKSLVDQIHFCISAIIAGNLHDINNESCGIREMRFQEFKLPYYALNIKYRKLKLTHLGKKLTSFIAISLTPSECKTCEFCSRPTERSSKRVNLNISCHAPTTNQRELHH